MQRYWTNQFFFIMSPTRAEKIMHTMFKGNTRIMTDLEIKIKDDVKKFISNADRKEVERVEEAMQKQKDLD
jgi:hypothetical protein